MHQRHAERMRTPHRRSQYELDQMSHTQKDTLIWLLLDNFES
jgi:hypothetical protein